MELIQMIDEYDPAVNMHDFCEMVSLHFLLKNSDIVTLHMSLRGKNCHVVDNE